MRSSQDSLHLANMYIGFDRDGTLEMPSLPMPKRLIEQLQRLEAAGAMLFVASGKAHSQLKEICDAVQFKPWMICAENGGHIVFARDQPELLEQMSDPDLQFFMRSLHTLDLPFYDEEIKKAIWSKKFHQHAAAAGAVLQAFIQKHRLNLDVFIYPDGLGGVDVVPRSIDKVNLLKHLPEDAVIHFFGDSENDLRLMQSSRVQPHAPSNAKDIVKDCVRQKGGVISEYPAGLGVSDILHQVFAV